MNQPSLVRTALVGLVLCLAALPAAAGRPDLVARAGVAVSSVHQDDLASDAREGLALGLGADIPLGGTWSLQPEVWYQRKGFHRGRLWDRVDVQQRTETVSVPVLVSYEFIAARLRPRAFAGLAVDVLLGSEISEPGGAWLDVTDQDESAYVSLVLGAGARLLDGRLDVDVRYQHGLTPATDFDYTQFDDRVSENQEFDDAFDRTWLLTAGVWF